MSGRCRVLEEKETKGRKGAQTKEILIKKTDRKGR